MKKSPFKSNVSFILLCLNLVAVFLLYIVSPVYAQTDYKTELENLKLLEENQTEKVHLHFDRTIFSPGEDIWFKAYLLEGTFHTLSTSSTNLHVDLISPEAKVIKTQVILMNEGVGYGDFKLDRTIPVEGTYEIRAYTNFMRNFDKEIFFKQNIVIKQNRDDKKPMVQTTKDIDLQFFPEGGDLVLNIANRVAFKAVDESGKGTNISISVFDEQNNEILKTVSVHNGMGHFQLIPKIDTKYYAKIDHSEWESKKIDLPKVSNGYSIFVGNQYKELLDFNICTSPENANGQQVSYIIQSRGKLFSTNKIRMNEAKKSVRIEKDKLPEGISSITVYNEEGVPVSERLIYNQLYEKVNVQLKTNSQNYGTREKVILSIQTKDDKGKAIPANLSLSVINQSIVNMQNELLEDNAGILPSILLNADLKGRIENPNFYFEDFDHKKHHYLDLVLLTHGWRKYVWKEKINTENYTLDYDFENGFTISGTSKKMAFKRGIPSAKVSLVMSEDDFYYDETTADEKGKFEFRNTHFMDTTTLVFQSYNKKDKRNTIIEVDELEYEVPHADEVAQLSNQNQENALNELAEQSAKIIRLQDSLKAKNYQLLEEIRVKGISNKKKDERFRLYKRADDVIEVGDEFAGFANVFDVIQSRVPSVRIFGFCPDAEVQIRGTRTFNNSVTTGNSASFLLDGMFVSVDDICSLPVAQIDKIEVLKGSTAAIFGDRGMNGVIAVYLKEAGVKWEYIPVGITKIKPKGYYRSREFYTPDYELPEEQFTGSDYRNTLYWEPNITTDNEGKAELSFFNSDDSGHYEINVESIGLNGGLGTAKSNFVVEPGKLSSLQ